MAMTGGGAKRRVSDYGVNSKDKRITIPAACNACRKRKVRCDGERPQCTACTTRGINCAYETESAAETHRQASNRKLSEVRGRASVLEEIFHVLRSGSRHAALGVLDQMRNGTDVDEILTESKNGIVASQTTYFDDFSSGESPESIIDGAFLSSMRKPPSSISSVPEDLPMHYGMGDGGYIFDSQFGQYEHKDSRAWLPALFDRNMWRMPTTRRLPRPFNDHSGLREVQRQQIMTNLAPPMADHFGNFLPPTSVLASNYLSNYQQAPEPFTFMPPSTMQTVNEQSRLADPFDVVFADLRKDLEEGVDLERLTGPHAYIHALDDEATFMRAPRLSQMVASMVKSIKSDEAVSTLTQYAIMWLHWTLWKWTLSQSQDFDASLPQLLRPTQSQLTTPHPRVFDFIFSPQLRDLMCQTNEPSYAWLTEACTTVVCDWPGSKEEALCRNGLTNEVELNTVAKGHVSDIRCWSLGPSVRQFLGNIDSYMRVRPG